jgi:hypothetical protein
MLSCWPENHVVSNPVGKHIEPLVTRNGLGRGDDLFSNGKRWDSNA